jgi:hypothetical protein
MATTHAPLHGQHIRGKGTRPTYAKNVDLPTLSSPKSKIFIGRGSISLDKHLNHANRTISSGVYDEERSRYRRPSRPKGISLSISR